VFYPNTGATLILRNEAIIAGELIAIASCASRNKCRTSLNRLS
jgi:hypothetical protein